MKKNKRQAPGRPSDSRTIDSKARTIVELESHRSALTWLDYLLAPLAAVIAAVLTFPHVGTAINWDDLLYMNASINTTPLPYILNRYAHIYLLKFFFFITGDCITAGRVYWCFMFFTTCVLVYFCAKMLAGKKGYLIGIIAALLFYIQPLFAKEFGCPLADFTAMLFVLAGVFVYLAFLGTQHKYRHWAIMALGFIFFWAMKSKETAVCMAVLFFGLGQDKTGVRSFRAFARDIGWVCLGGLAGCVMLMTLDQIFLHDAFFSVRLSGFIESLDWNINTPPETLSRLARSREVMSWYAGIAKKPLLVALFAPFILYLLVGLKPIGRQLNIREKMLWLVPLAMLLFLTYVRSTFWVLDRYYAPAIPVVCIWAAQFFRFDLSGTISGHKSSPAIPKPALAAGLIFLAFLVVSVLSSFVPRLAEYYNFMRYEILRARFKTNENVFYAVGIVPLMVTIFLAMTVLVKKRGLAVLFISFVCLFLLIFHPFRTNFSQMEATAQKSQWRFLPYKVFADQFEFDDSLKVLVSEDIHNRSWMLGNYVVRQCWMFNIFFNQSYTEDHFIHGSRDDILKADYTYALITPWDWQEISKSHNIDYLKDKFTIKSKNIAGKMSILLLKKR